jgi:hypothetical protein
MTIVGERADDTPMPTIQVLFVGDIALTPIRAITVRAAPLAYLPYRDG